MEGFEFSGFWFDPRALLLYRPDERDEPVEVKPSLPLQALQVLKVLLEQPGETLTRDDIVRKAWGRSVKPENVDVHIVGLRDLLEDKRDRAKKDFKIIESVRKRGPGSPGGYRLAVSVKRVEREVPWVLDRPVSRIAQTADYTRDGVSQPVSGFDERPAIAVLPFANVSGDRNQDYFADGITYNIISELASWRAFPVIGRGSTFAFKDRAIDIQSLGKQLGARYLVDGSAAKTTTRVLVTAQLIDATNGQCLLPERHERNVGDLFEIQREIVEVIVGSIAPEVLKIECERVERRRPPNPSSYEYFMRGLAFHYRYTKEDNAEAQRLFRQAIEADPKNAQAYALLAHTILYAVQHRWREDDEHNYGVADKLAAQAVALDGRAPFAHFALGSTSMFLKRTEQALYELQEVIRVNPSHAAAYAVMAHVLCYMGRPAEGLQSIERALRLSPYDPRLGIWIPAMAQAYYFLERYEDAVAAAQRALTMTPENVIATRFLAASLGQLGRAAEAALAVAFLRDSREPTLADQKRLMDPIYRAPEKVSHVLAGLQKAGLT